MWPNDTMEVVEMFAIPTTIGLVVRRVILLAAVMTLLLMAFAPLASAGPPPPFCADASGYGQEHIADGMQGGGWTELGHKPGGHPGKAGLCHLGNF